MDVIAGKNRIEKWLCYGFALIESEVIWVDISASKKLWEEQYQPWIWLYQLNYLIVILGIYVTGGEIPLGEFIENDKRLDE